MSGWTIYNSLESALDNIGYSEKGAHESKHFRHEFFRRPNEEDFIEYDLQKVLQMYEKYYEKIKVSFDTMCSIAPVTVELFKNAYHHSTGKFLGETYVGQKGVLVGTIQEKDFFNIKQIDLLKNRVPQDPELKDNSEGTRRGLVLLESVSKEYDSKMYSQYWGTVMIMSNSDGILVQPKRNSIHYSVRFGVESESNYELAKSMLICPFSSDEKA